MPAAAGHLADVVQVVGYRFQRDHLRAGLALDPTGIEHPGIQGRADHPAPFGDHLDLRVGELPVSRHQGAAVVVAGHHRPAEVVQRFPESLVGQVGQVEDHAYFFHGAQQILTRVGQTSFGTGAVRVRTDPVVRQADGAQAVLPPRLDLSGPDDRVGAFHAQDEAQRLVGAALLPGLEVLFQALGIGDHAHLALRFQHPVVGQLSLGLGVGDLLGGHARGRAVGPGGARDHRGHRDGQFRLSHFGQGDCTAASSFLGHAGFELTDFGHAQLQVPVPLQGVHGQVQVGVDHQHGGVLSVMSVREEGLSVGDAPWGLRGQPFARVSSSSVFLL